MFNATDTLIAVLLVVGAGLTAFIIAACCNSKPVVPRMPPRPNWVPPPPPPPRNPNGYKHCAYCRAKRVPAMFKSCPNCGAPL